MVEAQELATTSCNPSNYALSIQIQNVLRVLDALSSWVGVNTRIVITGHSVGSWVALQVAFQFQILLLVNLNRS